METEIWKTTSISHLFFLPKNFIVRVSGWMDGVQNGTLNLFQIEI